MSDKPKIRRVGHSNVLRVALIGCGAMSERFYAPALTALTRDQQLLVTALIDTEESRRKALETWFPSAVHASGLEAVRPGKVDFALLASPPRYHADQAVTLIQQAVHVLCEKPMATSLRAARQMIDAASETGCLLAVGLFRRFFPSTEFVLDLIQSECVGRPISFSWIEGGVFNWPAASPSFFSKSSSQGGVLADLGVHVLDLLLHWFGDACDVHYEDDAMGGLEANARLKLRFASGVEGKVRLSRDTDLPVGAQIVFERGTVGLKGAAADQVVLSIGGCSKVISASLFNRKHHQDQIADLAGGPSFTYHQCFVEQLRNFCRSIRGEEALRVPGSEALRSMELIERCYAGRKAMDLPWLSTKELQTVAVS